MLRTIRSDQLKPGMHVQRLCGSWLDHPFWRTSFLADADAVAKICASGVETLVIDCTLGSDVSPEPLAQAAAAPEATQAASPVSAPREATPQVDTGNFEVEVKSARALLQDGRALVEAMFGEARLGRNVDTGAATPLVAAVCASVLRNPHALISVARLKTADDYTYLHSMAVAGLMTMLARGMGLPEDEVHAAAKGGLLHDMGKAMSPPHVLNKPGRLTEAEFDVMRRHPEQGHRLLVDSGVDDAAALDIALHHHEKMDGTGYPRRLEGEGISQMARMAAICDVYDAVTSDRPYKRGWCPAEALRQMASWTGHFDPAIFRTFVKRLGIYPVGTLVRLQSQHLAVVLEQAPDALLKPRVRVFHCARRHRRILLRDVDLAAPGCQDRILQAESPDEWGLRELEKLWLP